MDVRRAATFVILAFGVFCFGCAPDANYEVYKPAGERSVAKKPEASTDQQDTSHAGAPQGEKPAPTPAAAFSPGEGSKTQSAPTSASSAGLTPAASIPGVQNPATDTSAGTKPAVTLPVAVSGGAPAAGSQPAAVPAATPPSGGQEAGASAAGPAERVDLLALVHPERDSRNGVWKKEGDALISPGQALTVLTFPYRVEWPFRVTILAERIQGAEALNVVVPFGGRPAMIVLEGFGQKLSGINLFNGTTVDQQPGAIRTPIFYPDRPTKIVCSVAESTLRLQCDDGRVNHSWSAPPQMISLDSRFWTDIPGDRISLTVYAATTRFRITRAIVERLTPEEIAKMSVRVPPPPLAGRLPPRPFPRRPFGMGWPDPSLAGTESPPGQSASPSPNSSAGQASGTRASSESSPPLPPASPPAPAPEEAQKRKESVCLIETPLGSGSGFVLAQNIVATNAHVVNEVFVDEINLVFGSQRSQTFRPTRILYEDELRDICLLEARVAAPPIPFIRDHVLERGERVVVIGNPSLGETDIVLRDAVTTGRISAMVHASGCDFYQVHAEISPGSSGGPVLNWKGEVIGMIAMKATARGEDEIRKAMMRLDRSVTTQAGFTSGRGIAFAIPAAVIAEALNHGQSPDATEVEKVEHWHNARVIFRRSLAVWAIHFLKFIANVPPSVREQEALIRFRRLPAAALRQIKQVDLPPPGEARALLRALEGPEVSKILRACEHRLDERFEALRGSSHLPEPAFKCLEDLRRAVNRVKGLAENPPTSYQNYSKAYYDQKDSIKQLAERAAERLKAAEAGYGG